MRDIVDMAEVVENVKAYAPPVEGMGGPHKVDVDFELSEILSECIHAIDMEGYNPDKCVFYMHPSVYNDLRNQEDMIRSWLSSDSFQGRPIRTHHTMPEDTILFMPPDAVSLGGKVYHPGMIAYAVIE